MKGGVKLCCGVVPSPAVKGLEIRVRDQREWAVGGDKRFSGSAMAEWGCGIPRGWLPPPPTSENQMGD